MSVEQHRAQSPERVNCFVLTVSDSRTLATETSGRTIAGMLEDAGHSVLGRQLVRDEPHDVATAITEEIGRHRVHVIITTGGTGIASRDSTYEAITALFDKRIDGFGELFRMLSYKEIGAAAMLSRATAGVEHGSAICMQPGAQAAVQLAMQRLILPEIGHIVRELTKDDNTLTRI